MPTRTWGGSKLVAPECDSGALPAELQPRKTKRNITRCPAPVKGADLRRNSGQRIADVTVRHLAEKLARLYSERRVNLREARRIIRKAVQP